MGNYIRLLLSARVPSTNYFYLSISMCKAAKLGNDRLVQIKEGYKTSTKTIKKRRLSHIAIFNIYNMSTALAHV